MAAQSKDYGKLTEDQFKRLIRQLPEFRRESGEFQDALKSASPEQLREVLGDGVWWAPVYELTLIQCIALLFYILGLAQRLKEVAQLPDPQEVLLQELENGEDDFEWDGGPGGEFTKSDVVGLTTALQRNVLSIMIYKRSLCALVAEAREGDDKALFDAVRIDRSAVSCPTISARISKAELLGEKRFFQRLISAMKGLSKKHWEGYRDLRYSLAMLREMGFDRMSDTELEHLLVDVLKVYPKSYAARKNLRKQYYESKKIKTL